MAGIRTATQTLLSALEDFGESEPRDCLVIYNNEAGDLCWSCTSDAMSVKFGLIESCKQVLIAGIK